MKTNTPKVAVQTTTANTIIFKLTILGTTLLGFMYVALQLTVWLLQH
jgi:hypothetical protein